MEPAVDYRAAAQNTRTVDRARRTSFWREHVTDNHGSLVFSFGDAADFDGGTRVQRAGDLQLVDFWSDPVAYERQPEGYDADGDDSLRIMLPLRDTMTVVTRTDRYRVGRGDATLMSMARPFRMEHDGSARGLILSLPRRLWQAPTPSAPRRWELRRGAGAVFAAMVREVAAQWGHLDGDAFTSTIESAVGILDRAPAEDDEALVVRARAVARRRCDDPGFGPADLAFELGLSLRSLQYGLRAADTSPAALIRDQRLGRAASRLRHAAWGDQTISALAHASGFASLSAFNTAFRRHFQETPADYRRGQRRPELNPAALWPLPEPAPRERERLPPER